MGAARLLAPPAARSPPATPPRSAPTLAARDRGRAGRPQASAGRRSPAVGRRTAPGAGLDPASGRPYRHRARARRRVHDGRPRLGGRLGLRVPGPDPVGGGPLVVLLRIAGVGLVVLGVASIVRRVRRLGEPIAELADATSRIEAGDYSVRVDEPDRGCARALGARPRVQHDGGPARGRRATSAGRCWPTSAMSCGRRWRWSRATSRRSSTASARPIPHHLTAILEETRVLERLIDDLRTVALSEAGTLPLHREPTDLGLLIADVARSFRPSPRRANDDRARRPERHDGRPAARRASTPSGFARSSRTSSRTRSATARPGRLSRSRWRARTIRSLGPDRGPRYGVRACRPEVADRVFDRFARSADSGGSGLGLAIAKYLVEAHGGEIGVLNAPGGGTTAWFRLPLPRG